MSPFRTSAKERRLDELLGAISNGVRRHVLEQLREGDKTAGELAAPYDLSLPAMSRHLRVLEGAGLVRRRVAGRTHRLQLEPRALKELDNWLAHYRQFWEAQLDALAAHLEKQ